MLQSGDEKLKAWFLAEHGLIVNQIPATPTPTPTPPPSPTHDDFATPSSIEAAPTSPEVAPTSPEAAPTPPSPRTPTTMPEGDLDV